MNLFPIENSINSFLVIFFDIKGLDKADVILDNKISKIREHISLNQCHYIDKILKKLGQLCCTPVKASYHPKMPMS